jgi:hypothetical protein
MKKHLSYKEPYRLKLSVGLLYERKYMFCPEQKQILPAAYKVDAILTTGQAIAANQRIGA